MQLQPCQTNVTDNGLTLTATPTGTQVATYTIPINDLATIIADHTVDVKIYTNNVVQASHPGFELKVELTYSSECPVSITATDGSETGPVNGQFTITRDDPSSRGPIHVDLGLSNTSAINGVDYTAIGSPLTVTIPDGQNSVSLDIPVIDDSIVEGTETVTATITADLLIPEKEYVISTASATVSIIDNDFRAAAAVVAVPTMSTWGLIFLAGLLGLVGLRKRSGNL